MVELNATRTSAPTRIQSFVDKEGSITLRVSEWLNIVNLFLPIEGTGSPEGVIEARVGQTFIDTSANTSSGFLYMKQKADISGNRKNGWRIAAGNGAQVKETIVPYTLLPTDAGVAATGTFNVTLYPKDDAELFPTIASISPGGTITVLPDGLETIAGLSSLALTPGQRATLMPITGGWIIV